MIVVNETEKSNMLPTMPPPPPPIYRVSSTASNQVGLTHDDDSEDDIDTDENDLTDKDSASSKSKTVLCIEGGTESDDDNHPDDEVVFENNQRMPYDHATVTELVASPTQAAPLANGLIATHHSAHSLPGSAVSSPMTSQSLLQRPTISRPLECDYEQSPTPLYLAIEAKEWGAVLEMMENDDFQNDETSRRNGSRKRPYPMSPKQQARCWVVRKEKDGRLRWRLLPIHAAIIFDANATVIDALLEAYPESASQKDDQGMLPLHLAFRNITLLLNDSMKEKPKRNHASAKEHDETRPSANSVSSSTCSSTAVNWLIVEALLTAYPQAIFSRDRKGRTPLQGGIVAAQLALKNEIKRKSLNNTPNQRKMAALKVLDLYTQIAIRGERNNWMKEHKLKNDMRLAALSEQHSYRLQDFYCEFQEEQKRLQDFYEGKMNLLQKQAHSLQERLQHQNENSATPSASTGISLKLKDFEKQEKKQIHQEQIINDLRKQNESLKKQVEKLSNACKLTVLTLQQHVLESDRHLVLRTTSCEDDSMNAINETSDVPRETLSMVDMTIQKDFDPNADVLSILEDEMNAIPSISTSSSASLCPLSVADETHKQEHHLPQEATKESGEGILSSVTPPLHRLDEHIGNQYAQVRSCDSSTSAKSFSSNKVHLYSFSGSNASASRCSHTPDDSRDEEVAENETSAGVAARKQLSSEEEEEDACAASQYNSVGTSDSLSFDQIKNEILGSSLVDHDTSTNHSDSDINLVVQSHRKQRSLPLITIRSDDETEMIAMMHNFSPAPSSSCSMASAVFPGGACAAEGFFMTSLTEPSPTAAQNHLVNMKKNGLNSPYKNGKRRDINTQCEPRHRLSLPDSWKAHLATNQVSTAQQPERSASVFIPTSKSIVEELLYSSGNTLSSASSDADAIEVCNSSSASSRAINNSMSAASASHKNGNIIANGGGTTNSIRSLLDTEEEIDD